MSRHGCRSRRSHPVPTSPSCARWHGARRGADEALRSRPLSSVYLPSFRDKNPGKNARAPEISRQGEERSFACFEVNADPIWLVPYSDGCSPSPLDPRRRVRAVVFSPGQLGGLRRTEAQNVTAGQDAFAGHCHGRPVQLLQRLQGGSSPDGIGRLGRKRPQRGGAPQPGSQPGGARVENRPASDSNHRTGDLFHWVDKLAAAGGSGAESANRDGLPSPFEIHLALVQ